MYFNDWLSHDKIPRSYGLRKVICSLRKRCK